MLSYVHYIGSKFQCFESFLQLTLKKNLANNNYKKVHFYISCVGHVDPGESDWVTALRETKEEAGLSEDDLEVC